MAEKGKGKRKNSPRGFYGRALDEAERLELEEASQVEGIDEEIALLRVKLRELLEEQPDRIDLHFEAANIIARLVRTRYQNQRTKEVSQRSYPEGPDRGRRAPRGRGRHQSSKRVDISQLRS